MSSGTPKGTQERYTPEHASQCTPEREQCLLRFGQEMNKGYKDLYERSLPTVFMHPTSLATNDCLYSPQKAQVPE